MATYKEIFGKQVKFLSSDPANQAEGQVWYNSTSGAFKSVLVSEAWSSGANTINLTNGGGAAGTQTAGLIFGGRNPNVPAFVSTAEEYNGSGWSATGALNTARAYIAGFGVQTAAVGAGGRIDAPGTLTAATEEYDGSTWTTNPSPSGDMGSARKMQNGGVGILTAGLGVGPSATEEYGGTTWTASNALNTTRNYLAAFGTQTAAAAAGGGTPPYSSAVEEYNGTSWTTSPGSLPAIRQSAAAAGTQTDGLIFGGELSGAVATNTAFSYDGSTWSAKPNMANSGFSGMGQGTGTAALASNFRGAPGVTRNTELFNRSANVVTAGAWAAGGTLGTARRNLGGAGTQGAALAIGGEAPATGKTESYDGSAWTEVADLNTARNTLAATGSQTAALAFGGEPVTTATETWDGSSWTTSPNSLNTAVRSNAGFGTTAAAVNFGGLDSGPARTTATETWDGSAWATSPNSLPAATSVLGGFGTSTAGVACGGEAPGLTAVTSEWGGTSWTSGGAMITARSSFAAGTGTLTDGLVSGGNIPAITATTEGYDGTTWSTRPSLGTARSQSAGLGPSSVSTAGLISGGYISGDTDATEEFTGETSAANYKTITTS